MTITTITPHMETLPAVAQSIWPQLGRTAEHDWILYGETALAVQLGHRQTSQITFLSDDTVDHAEVHRVLPIIEQAERTDTGYLLTSPSGSQVELRVVGGVTHGRIGRPVRDENTGLLIASLPDLFARLLSQIYLRTDANDYHDVVALLRYRQSMPKAVAGAKTLFGSKFLPEESILAVGSYDSGIRERLTEAEQKMLSEASTAMADTQLPVVTKVSERVGIRYDEE